MTTYQDLRVNKITKAKFDELVANGTITQDMITSQAWLFTDDQFISKSDINRWNNKVDSDAIPTKLSQLTNDTNYAKTSDIPTKTSQLINDSNYAEVSDIPTNLSQLKNDVGYANKSEIPTKLSELSNDANYAKTYDIPTKLSELANDSGYITDFIETDPTVPSWAKQETKPTYSKEEVGLGNVENKSSEIIRSEITSKNVTDALGYTPLSITMKGVANGLAELDVNGKVPASQLPSYVDDVLEFSTKSSFPTTGEGGKIYVALDTNLVYRWSGTSYVAISSPLALGETSSSAFRGDLGKIAYDHSQSPHAPSNAQENKIETIKVNNTEQPITDKTVNITVPTKLSELNNDSNYAKTSDIPTKNSQLENDSGFLTDEPKFNSSAASGITSTDISNWNNKVDKVNGKGLSTNDYTNDEKTKLSNIEAGAEVNVQGDWNTTDTTDDSFIKNKPTKLSQFTNDSKFIKSDGSVVSIVSLTYEEYKELEGLGKLDPDTEYFIEDAQSSINNIEEFVTNLILESDKRKHPIGSLEFNVSGTNPSSYFGFGTWELWGAGKVPVGVDTTQTEFNTVEKTGGSKYMQKHSHNWATEYCYKYDQIVGGGGAGLCNWSYSGQYVNPISVQIGESGSGNSGNLQPYVTCYMWKRTA